jgi:hypothetical protein
MTKIFILSRIAFMKLTLGNNFLVGSVIVALLTSCTVNPVVTAPVEQMVPRNILKHHKINAELEFIIFNIAPSALHLEGLNKFFQFPGDTQTRIAYNSELWKLALIKTLTEVNVFENDSQDKLSLTVTVLKYSSILFGGRVDVDTEARYQITDLKSGAIVYSKNIRTHVNPELRFSIKIDGETRALIAEEQAIRENIKAFVDSIDEDKLVVSQEINKS